MRKRGIRRVARVRVAVAAGLVVAALGATGIAWAAADPIVATDNSYSVATYSMDQGDRPVLQNLGPMSTTCAPG